MPLQPQRRQDGCVTVHHEPYRVSLRTRSLRRTLRARVGDHTDQVQCVPFPSTQDVSLPALPHTLEGFSYSSSRATRTLGHRTGQRSTSMVLALQSTCCPPGLLQNPRARRCVDSYIVEPYCAPRGHRSSGRPATRSPRVGLHPRHDVGDPEARGSSGISTKMLKLTLGRLNRTHDTM